MCCYCNTQTRTKAQIQWGHIFFHISLCSARVPLLAAVHIWWFHQSVKPESRRCRAIINTAEGETVHVTVCARDCVHFPTVPENTGVLSRCCWALNRPGLCRTTNPHDLNISCPSLHLAVFFYTVLFSFLLLPSSPLCFCLYGGPPKAPRTINVCGEQCSTRTGCMGTNVWVNFSDSPSLESL